MSPVHDAGVRCPTAPSDAGTRALLFERVARAAAAVASELRTARLVDVILEHARLLGATAAALFAADDALGELVLLGQRDVPPDTARRFTAATP